MTTPISTAIPSILQTQKTNLRYLLNTIKDEVKREINCSVPGTIQTFDPVTITCTVSFNYQKVLKQASYTAPNPTAYLDPIISYPTLARVPVIVLGGANGQSTYPIATGDPCLVLFCDRDIDIWLELQGVNNPPNTQRMHDLSDGVALVGLNPVKNGITYYTDGIYHRSAYVQATQNFEVGNGATGSFVSADGQTVTVSKGVIISIV